MRLFVNLLVGFGIVCAAGLTLAAIMIGIAAAASPAQSGWVEAHADAVFVWLLVMAIGLAAFLFLWTSKILGWALVVFALTGAATLANAEGLVSSEDESTWCTHLQWRSGDPVVGRYNEWNAETVCHADNPGAATLIAPQHDADRWIRHVSGPQACLFTATWTRGGPLAGTIGGGRECPRSRDDNSCGYIKPGWTIYVASGRSCGAYGVEECRGWCW